MKKIITSFGFGEHSKMLSLAVPSFYNYGAHHNYDCFFPNQSFFSDSTKKYPYSWWKIECIKKLLIEYDLVLWLDSDVIICDQSHDISNDLSCEDHIGLVIHEVPIGKIPNCGIWLVTKKSLEWLDELWDYSHFVRSDGWWEQAAVMYKLGFNPDENVVSLPKKLNIPTTILDYRWNPHVHDHRGLPQDLRFLHFTMFADRVAAMKNVCRQLGYMT